MFFGSKWEGKKESVWCIVRDMATILVTLGQMENGLGALKRIDKIIKQIGQ